MIRQDMKLDRGTGCSPIIDGKTLCKDESTCVAVNEFLDEGYESPSPLEFSIEADEQHLVASISCKNMGFKDKADLNLRLIRFLMTEIERVKNGY